MFAEVLDQMIERALIRQVVKRAEIAATDAEVDEAIAGIARENGITPEKLAQSVEAQGMPYAVYRERIRGEIEHAKVLNDVVAAQVRVDDGEVREIYDAQLANLPEGGEEFSLRLIVVTPQGEEPGAKAAACASVAAARARVLAGESFERGRARGQRGQPRQGRRAGLGARDGAGGLDAPRRRAARGGRRERADRVGLRLRHRAGREERRAFVPLPFESAKARLSAAPLRGAHGEAVRRSSSRSCARRPTSSARACSRTIGVNAPPPAQDDTEPGF